MQLPQLFRYGLPALGLAITLNGCHSAASENEQTASKSEESTEVADTTSATVYPVVKITTSKPSSELSLPGELISYYETDLYPKVDSYVRKMYVDIGDHVKAGQVLADMEAPELTAKLADAFAQVKNTEALLAADRATYRRYLKANQTPGAIAPYDIDVARGKVIGDSLSWVGAQARYQSAQEMVSYLKLRAPFSGVITDRQLAPGALVGPNEKATTPLFRLKQEDQLRLQVTIPEKYVSDVRQGTPIHFTVNSLPDQTFTGKVGRISYSVQRQIRSMLVEILIPNSGHRLVPGQFAQVQIPVQRNHDSLVVPTTAVVTTMQGQFVVEVADGKAKRVNVQKGMEMNGQTEVFGNVHAGDVVLKNGTDEVQDGTQIKTEPAAGNSVASTL
ncbi:efflux RND transporter periplasmic adaptor subunit [Spirosoma sp. SC4-14]|uniref:efflux RND transporter periplasmic adaptor subunit n=1 Tax=Spirosoma sp. SC4-14 TaxID=3128900 RepID=UPI0030CB212D